MSQTLHLFHSPLWVNFLWRTDLFLDVPEFLDLSTQSITANRLVECPLHDHFQPSFVQFLINIAELVDKFVSQVGLNNVVARNLGLKSPSSLSSSSGSHPNHLIQFTGYSGCLTASAVIDCLYKCAFLDRVMWAHGLLPSKLVQRRHLLTEYHKLQTPHEYNHFFKHIRHIVSSATALQELRNSSSTPFPLDSQDQYTILQASSHDVMADVHKFLSNTLYAFTGTVLLLQASEESGKSFLKFLQKVRDSYDTSTKISPPFMDSIFNALENFNFDVKKNYFFMWFHTVAFIFSPKFPGLDKDTSYMGLLQNTAIPISQLSRPILLVEQSIIKYFIRIWHSVSCQMTGDSQMILDDTFLDQSSDFSILINDLHAALACDSDENIVVDTMVFPSIVPGFQVYTFPLLRPPPIFYSSSEGRAVSKTLKRVRNAVEHDPSFKKHNLCMGLNGLDISPQLPIENLLESQTCASFSSNSDPCHPCPPLDNPLVSQHAHSSSTSAACSEHPSSLTMSATSAGLCASSHTVVLTPAMPKPTTPMPTTPKPTTSKRTRVKPQSGLDTKPKCPSLWEKQRERKRKQALARKKKMAADALNRKKKLLADALKKKRMTLPDQSSSFQKQNKEAKGVIYRFLSRPPKSITPQQQTRLTAALEIIDLTHEEDTRTLLLGRGNKKSGSDTSVVQHSISMWVPSVDPANEHRVVFQRETFHVPFTNHSYPFADLVKWLHVCGITNDEPPMPVPFCHTMSQKQFTSLSVQEQRALWRQGNLHLFEDHSNSSLQPASLSSVDLLHKLGVNMLETRSIYENQRCASFDEPMTGIRHGTLLELFSMPANDRLDCNVLDISLPWAMGYLQPECLRNFSLNHELHAVPAPVAMPDESLQWCLFATPPSRTDIHIDAGKFHTWINPQSGLKLWMVQQPLPEVEEVDTRGMDDSIGTWYGMILRPGDVLLMRANTNHRVVTLHESVTMGGHFYSIDNLERTVVAGLRENLWGHTITNTTHPMSEAMLYRLGVFLKKALENIGQDHHLLSHQRKDRLSVSPELEPHVFPPLAFMLIFPERFIPRLESGSKDITPPSRETLELRELSYQLGLYFLKHKPNLLGSFHQLLSRKLLGQLPLNNRRKH